MTKDSPDLENINDGSSMMQSYYKKDLINDKILLDRLSHMSVGDTLASPAITLSSIYDRNHEDSEDSLPMEICLGSMAKSLSLDVPPPTVNFSQEAKRPPL